MTSAPRYKRVLLKLSGESLSGGAEFGLDPATLTKVSLQIKRIMDMGISMAVVVGGGNIWRGSEAEEKGIDRVTADYAGMLATVINALALQDNLEKQGVITRVQSAIDIQKVAEPYIRRRAIRHLEKGRVVIFAAGTGNPYMTTDTAAALRSIEVGAEVLLMTKNNVDGIYTADPRKDPNAKKIDKLDHMSALKMRLQVMDATALSLCMEYNLPIIVFDVKDPDGIEKAVRGERIGSLVVTE